MADEVASMVVRLSADAAQLESTINSVANQLQGLEKSGGGVSTNTQKAIDKVTKSTQSYSDVVNASKKNVEDKKKALKEAEDEYTKTKKSVDESTKSLKGEQTQLDELNKTLEDAKQKRNDAAKAVKSASEEYEVLSKNLDKVTALEKAYNLQDSGKRWKDTGDAINTVTKPLQTTSLLLAAGGVAAAKFAIDFEDNFAAVQKTVEGTPEELEEVKQGIIDLTTTGIDGRSALPKTTAELTALAATGGQLGFARENIVEFTETMAQLNTATNLVGEEGAATLARFMNVMQIPEGEIRNVGSAVVDLGNNMATTEAEIMEMSNRMGKYGQTVGMGAADVMGYSAALSSLGVEAQLGGSAVGRTWLSIETAVAAGGKELQAFAKYSGKSAAEFKKQWETNASGTFMDLLKGLGEAKNLTLALGEVGINNTQDIQAIMSMASNYKLVADAIELSNTAYKENIALQTEADKKAETTASQLQIAKNNLVEMGRSLGEVLLPVVNSGATKVTAFAQSLASLDETTQKMLVSVAAGVAGLGAISKMTAGVAKFIGSVRTGWAGLIKLIPALSGYGPVATAVAVGLTAVGVAAVGVTKKYKELKHERENFADGAVAAEKAYKKEKETLDKFNELADEYKDLQLEIKAGDVSDKRTKEITSRMSEIAEWFEKEYSVKLDVDSTDVEETEEKIADARKNQEAKHAYTASEWKKELDDNAQNFEENRSNLVEYKTLAKETSDKAEKLKGLILEIERTELEYRTAMNEDDSKGIEKASEKWYKLRENAYADGIGEYVPYIIDGAFDETRDNYEELITKAGEYSEKVSKTEAEIKEYQQTARNYIKAQQELFEYDKAQGLDSNDKIDKIGEAAKQAGLNLANVATDTAVAYNGFKNLGEAAETGGEAYNKVINDSMSYMQQWGVNTQTMAFNMANALIDAGASAEDAVATINKALAEKGITEVKLEVKAETEFCESQVKAVVEGKDEKDIPVWFKTDENNISELNDAIPESKTVTVKFQTEDGTSIGGPLGGFLNIYTEAHGTQNFPGGLAMVNDERGVADPRELVIDKGQAFIPQGRDVILPLSKGAKVYTATQTKNIMNSFGIPRYAKGKSNSDAFTTARDNWSHYTKTHAVTVSEELEKWVEFSKQFKGNLKDVEDIEEQIFSLVKKQNQELNKMSEDYINIRTMLNDWEAVGDDPLSAYKRVEERNLASLNAGQLTEAEFNDIMTDFADNMLEGRIDQSFDWLDREQKYNNMTTEEYIAGLDRMVAYTNQAYADMAISEETYHEIMTNLTDKRRDAEIDAAEEAVDAWKKSADNWLTIRETFNDWEDVGDSKSNYYIRSLGSIEKLFRSGDLGWEEYMDMSQEAYLNFYKAEEERLDTELDEFRDMIDETESKFREEEQALRDSWTVEDRETDKAEVERLLGIYENSVTEAGQKKYKELLEQKKEIEREEELYNLEQDHKDILEKYEAEYLEKEEDKAQYLKTLHTDSFNIFSKTVDIDTGVDNINKTLETASTNNNTVLTRLAEVLEDLKNQTTNTYNDSRNITINSGMSEKEISGVIGNTVVSGFGDILITR